MRLAPNILNSQIAPCLVLIYQSAHNYLQPPGFLKPHKNQVKLENDLRGTSILVIEDNPMNQLVIKMITKKWNNVIVDFANNGAIGLRKLNRNHYDIILMDLQMPVMDGYETTLAIRKGKAGDKYRNVPIISVTSDVFEDTEACVLGIGMNKYMTKPVNEELLFQNIEELVKI